MNWHPDLTGPATTLFVRRSQGRLYQAAPGVSMLIFLPICNWAHLSFCKVMVEDVAPDGAFILFRWFSTNIPPLAGPAGTLLGGFGAILPAP